MKQFFFAAALALMIGTTAASAGPLEIGAPLPAFSLRNVNDNSCSPDDFQSAKLLIVVFTCNTCPYAKAYQARLIALQNQYLDQGVQFILINPNDAKKMPEDSFDAMKKRAQEMKYPFPYLHDESQQIAKTFGATRTPEVYLFGPDRTLIYQGQVDDNTEEAQVRVRSLKNAIEAALAGNAAAISPKTTKAFGCTIKWR